MRHSKKRLRGHAHVRGCVQHAPQGHAEEEDKHMSVPAAAGGATRAGAHRLQVRVEAMHARSDTPGHAGMWAGGA